MEDQKTKLTFTTETDIQYVKAQSFKSMAVVFLVLSLCASLGLLVALRTFLYLEAFVFIICTASLFLSKKNLNDFQLHFENDILYIKDRKTGESFEVYDIPASDFIINQTAKEKKLNYCSLAIKHTIFMCGGVKNCNELKEYISNHYE